MSDEIKEILDNLIRYRYLDDKCKQPEDVLTTEDMWLLLDYITNLQQELETINEKWQKDKQFCNCRLEENVEFRKENERLKKGYCELREKCENGECDCSNEEYYYMCESNMKLCNDLDDYKSRCEKAVDYITSEESIETFRTLASREEWLKVNHNLLNILNGGDKE